MAVFSQFFEQILQSVASKRRGKTGLGSLVSLCLLSESDTLPCQRLQCLSPPPFSLALSPRRLEPGTSRQVFMLC